MKLFFKVLGAIFALLILVAGYGVATHWQLVNQILTYSPFIMPSFAGTPDDVAEAQEQDIRYLRGLTNYDRSFSTEEQKAFNAQLDDMAARAGQMSEAEFYLGAAKAVAISGNGHTNISTAPTYRQFNQLGVKFFWFSDGLFIVRARSDSANLVGARVVAIEGRSPEDVNKVLSSYVGGAWQFRRLYSIFIMESPELMHAAGLAASATELTLTVTNPAGEDTTVALQASHDADQAELPTRRPWMTLRADALPDEKDGWARTLSLTGDDVPLYLRSPEENFLIEHASGGVYLRPQLLLEREETPILEKFQSVIDDAPDDGYAFIVVDLRLSPGGDYTKVIDFVKAAPDAVSDDGKLYIITTPQTFSAALVTAAFLKYYGGDKAVHIGDLMGDDAQFWAERGFPFDLPNSGYSVNYATGYHDWENGCAGKHKYCFTQNVIHEVPAGSLEPDIDMAPTYADYASGRDIIMDAILAENP